MVVRFIEIMKLNKSISRSTYLIYSIRSTKCTVLFRLKTSVLCTLCTHDSTSSSGLEHFSKLLLIQVKYLEVPDWEVARVASVYCSSVSVYFVYMRVHFVPSRKVFSAVPTRVLLTPREVYVLNMLPVITTFHNSINFNLKKIKLPKL